jgi:hypothetical protein
VISAGIVYLFAAVTAGPPFINNANIRDCAATGSLPRFQVDLTYTVSRVYQSMMVICFDFLQIHKYHLFSFVVHCLTYLPRTGTLVRMYIQTTTGLNFYLDDCLLSRLIFSSLESYVIIIHESVTLFLPSK